jgi:hypothetical protein
MELNRDLIVRETDRNNTKEIVIKKYRDGSQVTTKLSEVFTKELPAGLLHKDETGMGATYRELMSERNSIIVEPIKITASSKAKNHNAFYVGSETILHPDKVQIKDIKKYADDTNVQYKKIVVVADSLYKVLTALGDDAYKDYFILIDEIDSFQMDSSFRRSMGSVIENYKLFPTSNRAMVTATPLQFSDPELANEPVTYIRYDKPTTRTIQLHNTLNLQGAVIQKITDILSKFPDDKVMVAFNSVAGCLDIASYLTAHEIADKGDIKILCSINSRSKVDEWYKELDSDKLPAKLNFVTSAYFTGFDLHEQYHLISVSGNETSVHSLSDNRLKQIAGRCRETLLSETVIYDLVPYYEDLQELNSEHLITVAKTEIQALECIKSNFMSNDMLKLSYDKIRELIITNAQPNEHKYVRLNKNQEPVISYLNIDSHIESNRVRRELYRKKGVLARVLRQAGHKVSESEIVTDIDVEPVETSETDRRNQVAYIITEINKLGADEDPEDLMNLQGLTRLQKDIVQNYHYFYKAIDNAQILSMMAEEAVKKDKRSFNNLILAAFYFALHPDEHYKRTVRFHIPLNSVLTGEQLLNKWNDIFVEMNMQKKAKSTTEAVRLTNLHFRTTIRKDKQRKPSGRFIKSENPRGFTLIEHLPVVNHQTQMNFIFKRPF